VGLASLRGVSSDGDRAEQAFQRCRDEGRGEVVEDQGGARETLFGAAERDRFKAANLVTGLYHEFGGLKFADQPLCRTERCCYLWEKFDQELGD
jgi:hypothetical protein